jgi:hypothetical protein
MSQTWIDANKSVIIRKSTPASMMRSNCTSTTMHRSTLIPLLGFEQETKKILYTHSPWSIYVDEQWRNSDSMHTPTTRCVGMFPHERCWGRQLKPTTRSCSRTSQGRLVPHERPLRGITHVRHIDVVRVPFQQSSRRRWIWTGNPAVRCVRHMEFPSTRWHSFKRGIQAKKKRGRERDEWAKGVQRGLCIGGGSR